MAGASATAEGELGRTPLAHLLVYALDRRLTGAMFLSSPQGVEHVVRFARGAPVKVRPGDRYALLGQMLVDAGAIDEKTLEGALATQGLLGDVLLLAGRVERDALEKVAEDQFRRRMVRFFALPPETAYRYYDNHEELAEYGGDAACIDPLALLWAGLRTHGEVSAMMDGTLGRLGETPLRLHPSATVARFGLEPEEAKLLDELVARPLTLAELCTASFPGMARRLAYALAITRQIELGTGLLPLGAEAVPSMRGASATAVARMALRSTVHRLGAAAPDAPGDGERTSPTVMSSRRQRERAASNAGDEPPSSHTSALAPVSSVDAVPTSAPPPDSGVVTVEHPDPAIVVEADDEASAALLEDEEDIALLEDDEPVVTSSAAMATKEPATVAPTEAGGGAEAEDSFAGMSVAELFWLATEYLANHDVTAAVEACDAGRRGGVDDPDLVALGAWARAQLGGADLKALTVELDEVLGAHEAHVEARFYRGMLRTRLGDQAGSLRDLRRVVALAPGHEGACRELAKVEEKPPQKLRPSLFGKLFKG